MGLAQKVQTEPLFAEDIRLVIWDLDETFWDGTLTEGGIRYRQDHNDLVIALAQRGIMSAICSKNDLSVVEPVLVKSGLWEYFVFSSIDWTPKGPRIRTMLEEIGLRAPSVLFLDDNAMNLAQAAHMNPGLNVGMPDVIEGLLECEQLQGKPDPELTRLAQYRVKARKCAAQVGGDGDAIAFLRQSNVQVFIEFDVEAHIERAIELIERTNQLNFTKQRLPEDAEASLRRLLAHNTTDAALIRVRDDFGDYGFVGFYLTRRVNNARRLEHFCFSCRTLNMYIEHWLYDFLGRPEMTIAGEVLTDPVDDDLRPDWITPAPIEAMTVSAPAPLQKFDRIFARGGCDLASLMHYFSLHSDTIIEEFNAPKNGQIFRRDHTSFLLPALGTPLTDAEQRAAASLGYVADDFRSDIGCVGPHDLCFLSFWADADIPLYRHKETDLQLPYWLVGAQHHDLIAREDLRAAVSETDVQRMRLEVLARDFEYDGLLQPAEMARRYGDILNHLPADTPIVVILANERVPLHFQEPSKPSHPRHRQQNIILRAVAEGRDNVILIDPADHIEGAQDMIDLNHFKRPIYHKMYLDVMHRLAAGPKS